LPGVDAIVAVVVPAVLVLTVWQYGVEDFEQDSAMGMFGYVVITLEEVSRLLGQLWTLSRE